MTLPHTHTSYACSLISLLLLMPRLPPPVQPAEDWTWGSKHSFIHSKVSRLLEGAERTGHMCAGGWVGRSSVSSNLPSRLTPEVQPEGWGWPHPHPFWGHFFQGVSGSYSRKHGQVCPESEPAW